MTRAGLLLVSLGVAACTSAAARPVDPRLGDEACAQCRMTLVSIATAAQIAAPGAAPVIFDDLGCARDYLQAHGLPADGVLFVADRRTGRWHDARETILTRATVATPMHSGVIAHADRASRDSDPDAVDGETVPVGWLLHGEQAGKGSVP